MSVVVVSWVLALLAVFGLNYAHDVVAESRVVRLELERHQLRAWARSGVELARVTLENALPEESSVLSSVGPANIFGQPLPCGEGMFSVGEPIPGRGGEIWVPGIGDEAARLPVALADSITLAALPGMTPHGAQVLLQAIATAGDNRLPSFALLEFLDDASRACAHRYLSRYGDAVNVNTASPEVLRAVGLSRSAVNKILVWRAGRDRVPGTDDDRFFRDLGGEDIGVRACGFNNEEAAILAYLHGAGRLGAASGFFRFASRSWGDGYRGICEIRVVMQKMEEGGARVVEWTETWLE